MSLERTMSCIQNCPIEGTLSIIGGKWNGSILWHLLESPMRFGEIRRAIPDASPKMLTQRLRDLEEHGIIKRTVLSTTPFAVEYKLSQTGLTLRPIITALAEWGQGYVAASSAENFA